MSAADVGSADAREDAAENANTNAIQINRKDAENTKRKI